MSKPNKKDNDKFSKLIGSLRKNEPELKNPQQLTSDIMDAVRGRAYNGTGSSIHGKTIRMVNRILVAATVCLLMVFGIEEYIFFAKVKKLEYHASAVSLENETSAGIEKILKLNAGLHDDMMQAILHPGAGKAYKVPIKAQIKLGRLNAVDLHFVKLKDFRILQDAYGAQFKEFIKN